MEDIQGKVFADFNPPATTDGSYLGAKINHEATQKHLQMKFEQEIVRINELLKASKTKVTIYSRRGSIQLRATLPLKPDDTHPKGKDKKQYTISLGIPASFDGLKTAQEEAQELGKLIARQTFAWTDKYLGVQAKKKESITFREFYEQFEKIYFSTRKRTLKSESTFLKYNQVFLKHFFSDEVINDKTIRLKISSCQASGTRQDTIYVGKQIADFLGIEIDFKDLRLKHEPRKRDIPSDKEIINGYFSIEKHYRNLTKIQLANKYNWQRYQLIYGLIATYGLRPREVINNPDLEWLTSADNKRNTFKVHESNKTGYREVLPFVTEWVDLFDLKNPIKIEKLQNFCDSWQTPKQLKRKVCLINQNFKGVGLYFSPYDLRHACAIRAHLQGVAIKAAADNLGHSIDMHTKVYQRWFGLENRHRAFSQAFNNQNEVEKIRDELIQARKYIGKLETELARYKLKEMI